MSLRTDVPLRSNHQSCSPCLPSPYETPPHSLFAVCSTISPLFVSSQSVPPAFPRGVWDLVLWRGVAYRFQKRETGVAKEERRNQRFNQDTSRYILLQHNVQNVSIKLILDRYYLITVFYYEK